MHLREVWVRLGDNGRESPGSQKSTDYSGKLTVLKALSVMQPVTFEEDDDLCRLLSPQRRITNNVLPWCSAPWNSQAPL